jgi:hypothetical protein
VELEVQVLSDDMLHLVVVVAVEKLALTLVALNMIQEVLLLEVLAEEQ